MGHKLEKVEHVGEDAIKVKCQDCAYTALITFNESWHPVGVDVLVVGENVMHILPIDDIIKVEKDPRLDPFEKFLNGKL